MSEYFSNFPRILYDIEGKNSTTPEYIVAVNLMIRQRFRDAIKEEISMYYPYVIPEEMARPDILSFQQYGSVAYAYLIMLVNDIYDPLFDWPLDSQQFEKYLTNKYGSAAAAMAETKYYYQIIRAEVERTGTSERIPAVKFIVDQTTYDALDTGDRTTQTAYEWEDELNDNKRDIKLIDASFIQDIDYAVKRTFAS